MVENPKWTPQPWPDAPGEDLLDSVDMTYAGGDQTFDPPLRGVWVVTTGPLKVDTLTKTGKVIPQAALVAGQQYGLYIKKIWQSGSTAVVLGIR